MQRLFTIALFVATVPAYAADKVSFNREVLPILSDTCFHCHGPDAGTRKGKLRLDIRDDALKAGKSGELAIVPGKPDESEFVRRLFSTDELEIMPPEEAHKVLTEAQKDTLKRWIEQGAEYEPHWAYTPLVKPQVPAGQSAIDHFIREKLKQHQLGPSQEADKATLLRRLSLDLTGLPPTPAEVQDYLDDKSDSAYEKQVDRLLASPHFGERMAVWWLDVARFSDTVGFHGDQNQRIFPYREYVINAFNRNKSFDQFTLEQIAGDLLPNATEEQIVATGFNRLNMVTREGGAQPKEYLAKYGADRVRTVSGAWLGSTMGCAECHDHKFDPFTAQDFYALQAYFADVKQWGVYSDYRYSPNPELKGWNNEYPFPPERLVESPYLKEREKKLLTRRAELLHVESQKLDGDTRWADWKSSTDAFLTQNPHGWLTIAPVMGSAAASVPKKGKNVAPDAADTPPVKKRGMPTKVEADGRVILPQGPVNTTVATLSPPPGYVSSLRVEILPDAAHGGSVHRRSEKVSLTHVLSATLHAKGEKKGTAFSFRHADAEDKAPRYTSGEEIDGILTNWVTRAEKWDQPQTGYWLLAQPILIDEGDQIVIRLKNSEAGALRFSVSPLAPDHTLALQRGEKISLGEMYLASGMGPAGVTEKYDTLGKEIRACGGGRAWTLVTEAVAEPLAVRVLPRGNWMDETQPPLKAAVPQFLVKGESGGVPGSSRMDLARWLCSPENPLTPRAVMNRLWKQFYGNGLSLVVDDLGAQGEAPSHPELLDWIAAEFRDSDWNIKHMVKLMVMSGTYRQSSSLQPMAQESDPGNRLLSSQNARRLDAEFVRDNALFIAGLLNTEIGGPSAKPYQPADYYQNLQFPDRNYVSETDERQYRRGLYMHWQRTFLHPMLANFDAPGREECTAQRNASNTPQQALTLLNDPTFVEAARVFADRVLQKSATTDDERLQGAWQTALARPPKEKELSSLLAFLNTQRSHFREHPDDASRLTRLGVSPPAHQEAVELAAWTSVCRTLLNLQESITRY